MSLMTGGSTKNKRLMEITYNSSMCSIVIKEMLVSNALIGERGVEVGW